MPPAPRTVEGLTFLPVARTESRKAHWTLEHDGWLIHVIPPHWDEDWEPGVWYVQTRRVYSKYLSEQRRFEGEGAEAHAFTAAALMARSR